MKRIQPTSVLGLMLVLALALSGPIRAQPEAEPIVEAAFQPLDAGFAELADGPAALASDSVAYDPLAETSTEEDEEAGDAAFALLGELSV